jgi:hypothetical protein
VERMPHSIHRLVSDSNKHSVHQRDVFSVNYFHFLSSLFEQSASSEATCVAVIPTMMKFYLNIFLHTKKVCGHLRNIFLGIMFNLGIEVHGSGLNCMSR